MHDNNWDVARLRSDSHSECKVNFPSYSQSLEELEMEFKKELMELGKLHDQDEDDENYKHRQVQANYIINYASDQKYFGVHYVNL